MFGCLRLMLAIAVLLSHLGLQVFGLNPGVVAVVVFLMLSGYTTRHLMVACANDPARYYLDRGLRILPPYAVALLLGTFCWSVLRLDSPFLAVQPGLADWVANISVVSLNLFQWTGQDRFTVIPQAWSLALELQFYLCVPVLLSLSRAALAAVIAASIAVWFLSFCQVLDPDQWGYRLPLGTLFLFMSGLFIADRNRLWCGLLFGAMGLAATLLLTGVALPAGFNVEEIAGFFLGGVLVTGLARVVPTAFDNLAGVLSYPLFLSHYSVLWLFEHAGYAPRFVLHRPVLLAALVVVALAVSWLIHVVSERPLIKLRRRLREGRHLEPFAAWSNK